MQRQSFRPPLLKTGVILLLLIILTPPIFSRIVLPTPQSILEKMIQSTQQITTFQCHLAIRERVNGEMQHHQSLMKLQLSDPFKIYLRQLKPAEGVEVLYIEGKNSNKAAVNTNGFPWITIWLDPKGHRMRKNRHHHIYHSGFSYIISMIQHILDEQEDYLDDVLTYHGLEQERQFTCYKITYQSPYFHYHTYEVQQRETVTSIAEKKKVSGYKIIEENAGIDYYNQTLEPGQRIAIPSEYAKSIELYIDKETLLPVTIRIFDDKGLYEFYQYSHLKVNPEFDAQTFSLDNPDYGF